MYHATIFLAVLFCSQAHASDFSLPNQKPKKPILIASYGAGDLVCGSLSGGMKAVGSVKAAEVYYYAEFPTRLWIYLKTEASGGTGDYVLGENETCKLTGQRTGTLE